MKSLVLALAMLMSVAIYADEGLISRGGGGGHGGGFGGGGHGGGDFNRGGGDFNRGYDHGRNWDSGGGDWGGGYGGYILPAPTSYDPLQDPNDDMNQIYQQNLKNMERTGQ